MPGAQEKAAHQTMRAMRAPRGKELSCKGWPQEAILRMLVNSLDPEVAECPQELFLSGSAGKAAADWDSLQSIMASLRQLEGDQSLVIESGKPAGLSRTTPQSPRLLVTNVPGHEAFGNWLYAGTQTELPVLWEIYAAIARSHLGNTLAGKLVLGGGMGGAGGAQALAAAFCGAAFLGIDADADRIKRRVKTGYCEVMVNSLDEALRMLKNAVRRRNSVSIGLLGNCADLFPQLALRGVVPDLVADYTPTRAPFEGYIPAGLAPEAAAVAARSDAEHFRVRAQESVAIQHAGLRDLEKLGAHAVTPLGVSCILQLLLDDGRRLCTWLALSGEPADIARLDRLALEMFPDDERLRHWLPLAGKYVRFQGLPARVAWLRHGDLARFARAANDLVAEGEVSAPILFGCRLPRAEPTATRPVLAENGACWVWHSPAVTPVSPEQSSAQAAVADGTADGADRLALWQVA
jgi:urocanate hydratase